MRPVIPGEAVSRLADAPRRSCRYGGLCEPPLGGGACPECDYPRAYAHPESLLDAFSVDEVYVGGTAVMVYPDLGVPRGLVRIARRDGRWDEYTISASSPPLAESRVDDGAVVRRETDALVAGGRPGRASPGQSRSGETSPLAALGVPTAAGLLEGAARVLRAPECGPDGRAAAAAIVGGVAALLADESFVLPNRALERFLLGAGAASLLRPASPADVRTLLGELDRADRVRSAVRGPRLVLDDRRSRPSVLTIGPFAGPVRRVRIALLPGEADHVRVYDLRVGDGAEWIDDASVIDRLSAYRPGAVREEGPVVRLGARLTTRHLPGSALAGRLRAALDDPFRAALDDPFRAAPDDLLGGAWVELEAPLPPLGRVHLVYDVDPGHVLVGVVEGTGTPPAQDLPRDGEPAEAGEVRP